MTVEPKMGQSGSTEKGLGVSQLDSEELSQEFGFTAEQVEDMKQEFQSQSGGKTSVNPKQFCKILDQVRQKHSNLVLIDEEVSELLFSFIDCDHNGKADALELIALLSAFFVGTTVDKAKIVFQMLDHNNDDHLSKPKL